MKKKALIFGVTGQDGSYLADLLLKKGWGKIWSILLVFIEDDLLIIPWTS